MSDAHHDMAAWASRDLRDLSVMEIAVATVIARQDGSCAGDAFADIADICGREISSSEIDPTLARLVEAGLITAEGPIELCKLTPQGVEALNEAKRICLRAFDRGPTLFVFGEMISLFEWSPQSVERNHD